jgi:hypothetical protein
MKQVTLHITDKKYPLFMELVKSLDFVKKVEADDEPTKAEILEGLKQAVEEMKLIKAGKLKGRPAEELFNEL